MLRLTIFELQKIGGKRRFLLSCLLLLALNLFLLWYTNLPEDSKAGLSAYKTFQKQISAMTEPEKEAYMREWKKTIDGVSFVQEVLAFRGLSGEMGEVLTAQALESKPGVFEAYYELYQSGAYLKLTDSLWQEQSLMEELYEEWEKCADYANYLQSVQKAADTLNGISIFGGQNPDSFAARNVRKSAGDYARLSSEKIRWMPDKAIVGATENAWTDIFLLLSVFLFVGSLILEEKEKRLFSIIKSTRQGYGKCLAAKLMALLVHCIALVWLLYGENLLFYGATVGFGDLGAALQSVAAFRESCLSVSVGGYIVLSVFTKGITLFGFGALLTALCIAAETIQLPYVAGFGFCGISYLLYMAIPAASRWNMVKYLNLMGILKTEHFYGVYLNFNLFGYPVSCLLMSWGLIGILTVAGIVCSAYLYGISFFSEIRCLRRKNFYKENRFCHLQDRSLALKKRNDLNFSFFRPHANLLRHEAYKIMVVNRAALVLLLFSFLVGNYEWRHSYSLSVQETYYQNIMLQLEGELTEEKKELVLSEQSRYQEAIDRVSQIDQMVSAGEISESTGENWKSEWYAVTAFYPTFTRVWEQYQQICAEGGHFVYDTGYLSLFGVLGENFLTDFLLLCTCIILAFGNTAAMEDTVGAWKLLGSTWKGKRKVLLWKACICGISAALLSLIPFVCRMVRVNSVYPLRGLCFSVGDIPYFREHFADTIAQIEGSGNFWDVFASCGQKLLLSMPIWSFMLLFALSQAAVLAIAALAVFVLSCWRKEPLGTYFLAALILLVPLVLMLLGFSAAAPFSLYPFYSWVTY